MFSRISVLASVVLLVVVVPQISPTSILLKKPPVCTLCTDNDIDFWLYTNDCDDEQHLDLDEIDESLVSGKEVVVLIADNNDDLHCTTNTVLRPALLDSDDKVVILVTYRVPSITDCYPANANIIADRIAKVLNKILSKPCCNRDHLHIVGVGLGAQIAGITTGYLNFFVVRITAINPEEFPFRSLDKKQRLDDGDGIFVNVIHTDMGLPFGDIDIFVNVMSPHQPGCKLGDTDCSMKYAIEFYAESFRTDFELHRINNFMKVYTNCLEKSCNSFLCFLQKLHQSIGVKKGLTLDSVKNSDETITKLLSQCTAQLDCKGCRGELRDPDGTIGCTDSNLDGQYCVVTDFRASY